MVPRETAGDDVIRLAWPDTGREEAEAVAEVLESGYLTMGPKVAELEGLLAEACRREPPRCTLPFSRWACGRATR